MSLHSLRQTVVALLRRRQQQGDGSSRATTATTTAALACVAAVAAVVLVARTRRLLSRRDTSKLPRPVPPRQSLSLSSMASGCACDGRTSSDEVDDVDVRVVYGSELGNAEEYARGLTRTLCEHGVRAQLIDPDAWPQLDRYLAQRLHNDSDNNSNSKRGKTSTLTTPSSPLPSRVVHTSGNSNGNSNSSTTTAAAAAAAAGVQRRPVYLFVLATHGVGEPSRNFARLFAAMSDAVATDDEKAMAARATTASSSSSSSNSSRMHAAAAATITTTRSTAPDAQPFAGLWYAVFGLGSSAYRSYCRNALMTKALLKKGGACELYRVGFGDALKGNEDDAFDVWQREVMRALHTQCGLATTTTMAAPSMASAASRTLPLSSSSSPPRLQLRFVTSDAVVDETAAAVSSEVPVAMRLLRRACVAPPRQHDTDSGNGDNDNNIDGAVYHLTLDAAGRSYEGGDYLGVYARNPPAAVTRLTRLLGLTDAQLRMPVKLHGAASATSVLPLSSSPHMTLRHVLECCVDLCGQPRRLLLRSLAQRCRDARERDAFVALLSHEQQQQQQGASHTTREHHRDADGAGVAAAAAHAPQHRLRTIVDYMERFPSCCGGDGGGCGEDADADAAVVGETSESVTALSRLLELLPRMQPRYYSIASDSLTHGSRIELFVRVVRDGLASHYLCERLAVSSGGVDKDSDGKKGEEEGEDAVVYAFVRRSSFHAPAQLSARPIIFIAAGTGIAGVVGLCYRREALLRQYAQQQRQQQQRQEQRCEDTDVCGPCVLLFGARSAAHEYFVRDELQRWALSPDALAAWDAAHPGARVSIAAARAEATAAAAAGTAVVHRLPCAVVSLLDCAFSRDQAERHYVTHLMQKHAAYLYTLLTSTSGDASEGTGGALLYVSGDAAGMARDVERTLCALLQEHGGMSQLAAMQYVQRMESEQRYIKDVY